MEVPIVDFKYDAKTGEFTCYVNTKHNIDHAGDRPQDGCYSASILKHTKNGTMPKMLWSHNPYELPVGVWVTMEEDAKGLKMSGKLAPTIMGKDIKILAEIKALDSFSIGYYEIESKWNAENNCNDLIELDIREASWVNFACDENAMLESIKSKMKDGELPQKRELQSILRDSGFSKSQAEKITNHYNPEKEKAFNIADQVAELGLFK